MSNSNSTKSASFKAGQMSIVKEMFLHTADENYIVARWAAAHGLETDFLWNALHSLEKYMKATLLLNGQDGRGAHNIIDLYERLKEVAGDLVPARIVKPSRLKAPIWIDHSTDDFVARLNANGNADNRYLVYGSLTFGHDLHMLDALVFAIRRLVLRLDDMYLPQQCETAPKFTWRDLLQRNPTYYQPRGETLDKLIKAKEESELRHAALNLNMAFAPEGYKHTAMRGGISTRTQILQLRIFDLLASDNLESATEGIALANWTLENIQLPKAVKAEVKDACSAARAKHNIP